MWFSGYVCVCLQAMYGMFYSKGQQYPVVLWIPRCLAIEKLCKSDKLLLKECVYHSQDLWLVCHILENYSEDSVYVFRQNAAEFGIQIFKHTVTDFWYDMKKMKSKYCGTVL